MLRRIALLVALLVPVAGLAQTSGQVLISPTTFGTGDCTSTAKSVTLEWTSSSTPVAGANEIYKVWVSHTDTTCPTTDSPAGFQRLGTDIPVTTATPTYSTTRSDFISTAGLAACTTNATISVCIQHWVIGAASAKGTATGSATLEVEPPPFPVLVSVAPGDSALFVSWADGTKNPDGTTNTIAAVSYNVTAVGGGVTVAKNSTSKSYRLDGLTNGVIYSVTVTSLSAGGNESVASSPPVLGTPQPVDGFWEQYTKDGGPEQGGCGGGPAGVVALLGVALALRGLRRRS
jgi:hypothetical protein